MYGLSQIMGYHSFDCTRVHLDTGKSLRGLALPMSVAEINNGRHLYTITGSWCLVPLQWMCLIAELVIDGKQLHGFFYFGMTVEG